MNKLQELLDQIASMDEVKSVETLKQIIERSPELLADYRSMLAMQKRLVRETVDGLTTAANKTKSAIDDVRLRLESHPVVNEYINGLSSIQETIQ